MAKELVTSYKSGKYSDNSCVTCRLYNLPFTLLSNVCFGSVRLLLLSQSALKSLPNVPTLSREDVFIG